MCGESSYMGIAVAIDLLHFPGLLLSGLARVVCVCPGPKIGRGYDCNTEVMWNARFFHIHSNSHVTWQLVCTLCWPCYPALAGHLHFCVEMVADPAVVYSPSCLCKL